jgi:hypothetical protein
VKKRLNFRKSFGDNLNINVQVHTVKNHKPVTYKLVNLSATGLAFQRPLKTDEGAEFKPGDIVFVDLKELGIKMEGVSGRVVRSEMIEDQLEFGICFVSVSPQLQDRIEQAIGWNDIRKSLRKPRSCARAVYAGEEVGFEIPAWLESLLSFASRTNGSAEIKNPIQAKSSLVEWIESSVDGEQLGVSLVQSL